MEYIISDIHGEYDLFIKLLKKIGFDSNDKMIICGDIFDKGPQSIKLLKYIRKQNNMIFIIGNHEYDFLKYYNGIMRKLKDGFNKEEVLKKINSYFPKEDCELDWDDLNWLEDSPFYYETNDYICVHAGISINSNNEVINPLDNDINVLVYDRRFKDPELIINNSKCVFYGHTPTSYYTNEYKIITYKRKESINVNSIKDLYKVHLDWGTYLGGVLGCFCIDNCESYYVKKDLNV